MLINSMKHLVFSLGSLLDFLKSDTGSRLHLPKLIDFSAQVSWTPECNVPPIRTAPDCEISTVSLLLQSRKEEQKVQNSQFSGRVPLGIGD